MAVAKLDISEFLKQAQNMLVLDVRSPSEYLQGHIPSALSFPLFTDEERKIIGTAYKQESRQKAIKIGLESFGKNMLPMVEKVEEIFAENKNSTREIGVHCWRGGMRSASVAWLLDLYGFKVYLLKGGYKAYRHWVLSQFEKKHNLLVLSGYTGSNKTGTLKELKKTGHKVIDLEGLAKHKGSAFGNLEMIAQPSQEHFENMLATELYQNAIEEVNTPIWVEAESQRIGQVNLPVPFFKIIRNSSLFFIEIPFEERLSFITEEYGKHDKEKIIEATSRISKKLGGLETKTAINFMVENDLKNCFTILLKYYDKLYKKSTLNNEFKERKVTTLIGKNTNAENNAKKILEYVANN